MNCSAIIRHINIRLSMAVFQAGELSNQLSDEFKQNHSDIPWTEIRGMRNLFAHEYYGMDIVKIGEVAVEDIPALAEFCEKVLTAQEKYCDIER